MLLLASTSDLLRVVTSAAVTVDVHASWIDFASGTNTPGRQNTAITTATTTTIVPSPGSSVVRNAKLISIRNKSTTGTVTVTVQHTDGATTIEVYAATLGPGQSLAFHDGKWFVEASFVAAAQPWETQLIACLGNGDPSVAMTHYQRASNIAATPTNISSSVARWSVFSPRRTVTIHRIRYYGVGSTTGVYQVAIYRYSDLARVTDQLAMNTAANTWGSVGSALDLALSGGTTYFIACSVNATGTTPGPGCVGTTAAATTGQIATAPESLPGSLSISGGYVGQYLFQFAVTSGALPATAPTLAAQAAWTGGMPLFFLDAADV
jgi:hypothetical protein